MKYTLLIFLAITLFLHIRNSEPWSAQQKLVNLLNRKLNHSGRKPLTLPIHAKPKTITLLLIIILSGDIEMNPGPKTANIFPCGLCERPVTWSNEGICCDCCSIWHHRSCIELCTTDYELLQRSNVQWMCCKCDSLNVSSFTYHAYEIENESYYEPLTTELSYMDSFTSLFSPLKTSSPKTKSTTTKNSPVTNKTKEYTKDSTHVQPFNICNKRNLRFMTVNCRSIKDKAAEFKTTVSYTKPDIIIGTESWLKGIKPGKNPSKDAIKSSEIFPENYTSFRNDRGTLGGGVFVLVHNSIIGTEQPKYVTNCEIEWVKYYMPHRNKKSLEELEKAIDKITEENKNSNIILAGDFNCPDIDWNNLSIRKDAPDPEVQKQLIDITSQAGLTQIHEEPTRENNILDLVFTTNTSLVKTSTNIPGISDHAIIITDTDIKPYYHKSNPRKVYIWSRANWEDMNKDLDKLAILIRNKIQNNEKVNEVWLTFKQHLFASLDKHIPSKFVKSNNRLPWITHKIRKMLKKNKIYTIKLKDLNHGQTTAIFKRHAREKSEKQNGLTSTMQ